MVSSIGGPINNPERCRPKQDNSNLVQPIKPITKNTAPSNDQCPKELLKYASFSNKNRNDKSKSEQSAIFDSKEEALNYIRKILANNSLIITNDNFTKCLTSAKQNLHKNLSVKDPYSVTNYKSSLHMLSEAFKKLGFGNQDKCV